MRRVKVIVLSVVMSAALNGCKWLGNDLSDAKPSDKVALRSIYTDNMVFQRNVPLKVCGTGEVGKKVIVTMDGEEAAALASRSNDDSSGGVVKH